MLKSDSTSRNNSSVAIRMNIYILRFHDVVKKPRQTTPSSRPLPDLASCGPHCLLKPRSGEHLRQQRLSSHEGRHCLKTAGHQSAIPSDRQIGLKSMTQHIPSTMSQKTRRKGNAQNFPVNIVFYGQFLRLMHPFNLLIQLLFFVAISMNIYMYIGVTTGTIQWASLQPQPEEPSERECARTRESAPRESARVRQLKETS
jgi:hypothetical protein